MPSVMIEQMLVATCLLFTAHTIRAIRWAQLFNPQDLSTRFNLLFALSLGYGANVFLPFRLGEFARAYYVTVREPVGFAYVFATVFVERLSDLVFIALILIGAHLLISSDVYLGIGLSMIGLAGFVLLTVLLVRKSDRFRRLIWSVCSVFNEPIRNGLAELVWTIGEIALSKRVLAGRYLGTTLIMWLAYGLSYYFLGLAIDQSLIDSFLTVFTGTLIGGSSYSEIDGRALATILLYSILPIFLVLMFGFARQWSSIARDFSRRIQFGDLRQSRGVFRSRSRFKESKEFHSFLASHFSGNDQILSEFSLVGIDDGEIVRFYNGGSDAITALVLVDDVLRIRKFASGPTAKTLAQQSKWLKEHSQRGLSLVEITDDRASRLTYQYDMPLIASANDFYEVIHTTPIERSSLLLETIFNQISTFHQAEMTEIASDREVLAYLSEKAADNASQILAFARGFVSENKLQINGESYNLSDWKKLQDSSWLRQQINRMDKTSIHGDLTIENIIVAPEREDGFYIIDPNPENIFNSPLIDFAKLMQSLHLGYEALNRGSGHSAISGNSIDLVLSRTHAYTTLHSCLENMIVRSFGEETLREIYFHELINYLRLTPYKIKRDRRAGITFFACTCILLARYLRRIDGNRG